MSHDAWGIDVSVAGSQTGLMLPHSRSRLQRRLGKGAGRCESEPCDAFLLGLAGRHRHQQGGHLALQRRRRTCCSACAKCVKMLEEGRAGERLRPPQAPQRRDARLPPKCGASKRSARSRVALAALTGVVMPEGHDADNFRKVVLENFDMSLGTA
jgi:alanine-glyoxylate transaminase/serine-glyoxylate transaminase/serine-pyruvate transaminase